MQKQKQKSEKKNGNAPSSSGAKPARQRYKGSNRAQERSVRNLMHRSKLTEQEARDVVFNGKPIPKKAAPKAALTAQQSYERYLARTTRQAQLQRVQEGTQPIGQRTLLGVPLTEVAIERLVQAVTETEERLTLGMDVPEEQAACDALVAQFEHDNPTVPFIRADVEEVHGEVFITRDLLS
jgi:hypothetical protein